MWLRSELKARAKDNLRGRYWTAFAVCMIVTIITVLPSNASSGTSNFLSLDYRNISPAIASMIVTAAIIAGAVSLAVSILVANHLEVGAARFFLNNRSAQGNVSDVFYAFKDGKYGNVFAVMFMKTLFIWLWSLLLVVPGIIKVYQYYLVPYILAENPEMKYGEALALSKYMMDGHKLDTFVLELSFIGWELLGLLLCCIGGVFISPYKRATYAELYCELKPKSIDSSGQDNVYHSADMNY